MGGDDKKNECWVRVVVLLVCSILSVHICILHFGHDLEDLLLLLLESSFLCLFLFPCLALHVLINVYSILPVGASDAEVPGKLLTNIHYGCIVFNLEQDREKLII